ncbi:MAG: CBS domain-containing protein [Bacteriovorax sp.]
MNLAKEVMIHDSSICTVLTSIDNIQKIMKDHQREEVLIVDTLEEKHLLGQISENTISELSALKSVLPSQLNAEQCVTPIPAIASERMSVDECLRIMDEHHMSRIPVVDEKGHCTGVVDKEGIELIPI